MLRFSEGAVPRFGRSENANRALSLFSVASMTNTDLFIFELNRVLVPDCSKSRGKASFLLCRRSPLSFLSSFVLLQVRKGPLVCHPLSHLPPVSCFPVSCHRTLNHLGNVENSKQKTTSRPFFFLLLSLLVSFESVQSHGKKRISLCPLPEPQTPSFSFSLLRATA